MHAPSLARLVAILKVMVFVAAALGPAASHLALLTGYGIGLALPFAIAQPLAAGLVVAGFGSRAGGLALAVALLAGLAWGARHSTEQGLVLASGVSHALLYAGLLAVFGASLLPQRVEVVTAIARRLNPGFHEGMRFYTRAVTWAWCGCFALQLAVSALLLELAPREWWLLWVNFLHMPVVLLLFSAEYALRRRLFPGPRSTDMATMIRGFRNR